MEKNENKRKEIRNILIVFGGSTLLALLVAVFFIYFYGPSGLYKAGQTILNPWLIERINYQDQHPRTGKQVHFLFDKAEFSFYDPKLRKNNQTSISQPNYEVFYNLIAEDQSLKSATEKIEAYFLNSHPVLLTILMKTAEGSQQFESAQVFQVVQFVEEDYYRVQLHGKQDQGQWAYFYHENLYQKIYQLFQAKES